MPAAADQALASELGLVAADVETLRRHHLTEGVEWRRGPGSVVTYTPEGIAALRAHCMLPEKKEEAPAPAPLPSPDVLCRVARLCANARFVEVTPPAPDRSLVAVQIKPNTRLKPGISIRCRLVDGQWRCTHPGLSPSPL